MVVYDPTMSIDKGESRGQYEEDLEEQVVAEGRNVVDVCRSVFMR